MALASIRPAAVAGQFYPRDERVLRTQLAEMLSTPDQPVTRQWVLGQMAAGNIPSIKVGRYRWYTAECAAELARRIDRTPAPTVSG